jgi:hypothetical protein
MSYNDLRVFVSIASFQGTDDICYPSIDKISERAGVHVKKISTHTNNLVDYGWIQKVRVGKGVNNRYRCLFPVKSDSTVMGGSDTTVLGGGDSTETVESIVKHQSKTPDKTPRKVKPSKPKNLAHLEEYINANNYNVDPESFWHKFESEEWYPNGKRMRSWMKMVQRYHHEKWMPRKKKWEVL